MAVISHLGISVVTFGVLLPVGEPTIDHQAIECSVPGKNVRVCAYVLDDGEVKRTRVYFRAAGRKAFYWSEMLFDGIQSCATLPVASHEVGALEYYLWAVDDHSETTRTRLVTLSLSPTSPCLYPPVDEDPERTRNLVVNATTEDQGDEIEDFEAAGPVELVPIKKR